MQTIIPRPASQAEVHWSSALVTSLTYLCTVGVGTQNVIVFKLDAEIQTYVVSVGTQTDVIVADLVVDVVDESLVVENGGAVENIVDATMDDVDVDTVNVVDV
jgi:hypothetical protein